MTKRCIAIGTLLAAMIAAFPALGQSAAPATVDLSARLKQVEANPQQLDSMYKAGRRVAAFCGNCHGDGGNSVKSDVPNLAGQNAYYLLSQLRAIGQSDRKTNEFKKRLVNAMSTDEKIGMVVFYAMQPVTFKPQTDAALVKKGADLYVKACVECHEKDGRGTKEFSRVAGQQTVYLTTSLKGYRDNSGARMDREMIKSLKPMNDADINALVAYCSSMK